MKKELASAPWLKRMTAEEFELWWLEGQLAKEWFHLNESQKAKAAEVKSLFKTIVTGDNLDAGLIFGLMSLASNLHMELVKRRAYQRGREEARRELRAEFLQAIKTMKENPLAHPLLKTISVETELMLTAAKSEASRRDDEFLQEVRNTAVKTNDAQTFLSSLICLDAMPGKMHTLHVRNFFVCLFADCLKHTGSAGLVKSISLGIIEFCFCEKMNPTTLRRARSDCSKSFPNWRGIATQLFAVIQTPKRKPSKLLVPH